MGHGRLYLQDPTSPTPVLSEGQPGGQRHLAATCGSAFKLIKVLCPHCLCVSMLSTLIYWASVFSLLKLPGGLHIALEKMKKTHWFFFLLVVTSSHWFQRHGSSREGRFSSFFFN